jgi:hypothetical protein
MSTSKDWLSNSRTDQLSMALNWKSVLGTNAHRTRTLVRKIFGSANGQDSVERAYGQGRYTAGERNEEETNEGKEKPGDVLLFDDGLVSIGLRRRADGRKAPPGDQGGPGKPGVSDGGVFRTGFVPA